MTLAEKLVSLREKYGMDGAQTAQELGVAPERLAAWEDGSETPGPSGLMSIADVFDVELEWLLDEGRSGEPEPRRARYSRFCMADRVFTVAFVLLLILRLCAMYLVSSGVWLRLTMGYYGNAGIMLVHVCVLVLFPLLYFTLGWLAAALLCRFLASPEAKMMRFCSISGWVLFALFCVYVVLSVFVTLADNAPGALILLVSPLMRALASAPEWLLLPGALLGLAHRRPPRRA